MSRIQIFINEKWCKGCGICEGLCPKKVIKIKQKEKVHVKDDKSSRRIQYMPMAVVENLDACIGCRICEKHCPDFAIQIIIKKRQK